MFLECRGVQYKAAASLPTTLWDTDDAKGGWAVIWYLWYNFKEIK